MTWREALAEAREIVLPDGRLGWRTAVVAVAVWGAILMVAIEALRAIV